MRLRDCPRCGACEWEQWGELLRCCRCGEIIKRPGTEWEVSPGAIWLAPDAQTAKMMLDFKRGGIPQLGESRK